MRFTKYSIPSALAMAAATQRTATAFVPAAGSSFGVSGGSAAATTTASPAYSGGGSRLFLLDRLFSTSSDRLPVMAEESVMDQKKHGTSDKPVQKDLRWNCDYDTADRICNFNRHYAEYSGYWQTTEFLKYVKDEASGEKDAKIDFYDSVTGAKLFTAPVGRSMEEFLVESAKHGWPSFRDDEVNWDYVRCLRDGECVSTTGTHLGHNIPDRTGNRYCINLVSVAGKPEED